MNKKFGQQIIKHLQTISEDSQLPRDEKKSALFRLFTHFINEITYRENIQLTTLFSKLSFVGNKYRLRKVLLYYLHGFRKAMEQNHYDDLLDIEAVSMSFHLAVIDTLDLRKDRSLSAIFFSQYGSIQRSADTDYIASMEVYVDQVDTAAKRLFAIPNDSPFDRVTIAYDQTGHNESFTSNIDRLDALELLPVTVHLHDIQVMKDQDDLLIPSVIVLEPHYLLDVTSIASTFDHAGSVPERSMIARFHKVYQSVNIFIGNVANYFLDQIIHHPDVQFDDLLPKIFGMDPLLIASYDDMTVRTLVEEAHKHFDHLKSVVRRELYKNGITGSDVYLEPSFYAPAYGLQGRLDIFYQDTKANRTAIIELKSSKVFRPNTYRLNNAHYVQTLLYDLLIKAVYGKQTRANAFILYSKMTENQLRHAPVVQAQQREALVARNAIWLDLMSLENSDASSHIFDRLAKDNLPKQIGFQKEKLDRFQQVYQNLDDDLRAYFKLYAGFIAREQRLSKVGNGQLDRLRGRANLWLSDIDNKKEQFDILNHLTISDNQADQEIPIITLSRTDVTATLSNFRIGDIVVLYPDNGGFDGALKSQVFKANIIDITATDIAVRLRNSQYNMQVFEQHGQWHVEHDMYDSSFSAMYRFLFSFVSSERQVTDLWLGQRAPESYTIPNNFRWPSDLTAEQGQIYAEIIHAEEYYLLWGPPGTGKTSVMLRSLVRYLYYDTDETILLLAYTNRAVDEICEALSAISDLVANHFIRIGSRYATKEKFRCNLLNEKTANMVRRSELTELIAGTRIFVGTLSSIAGKESLFQLQNFDRIIVDEASQILEPMLLDLLIRIPKTVLIGDHNQLPAVVQQNHDHTMIKDDGLNDLGLRSMADSLFERLYKRAQSQGWDWAVGQLSQQGRMHQDLMAFANEQFYHGSLGIIAKLPRLSANRSWMSRNQLQSSLADEKRVLFIPNTDESRHIGKKTNEQEAETVSIIVGAQIDLLHLNGKEFSSQSIGIITPFRAQIACIREQLLLDDLFDDRIMIDTVERFQGDAKDLIIISFCMNHESQMRSLISKSADGIDRKLNVALTRAKEQLVLLGNQSILSQDETYRKLIEWAK